MAQIIDLGKIRFNWAGTYDETTEYSYNDLVKYGPSLYAFTATSAATNVLPTNIGSWSVVTEGIKYKGVYDAATLYYKNDLVIDGQNTYIVITQHTSATPAVALGNVLLEIIALGQEGIPSQVDKAFQVLQSDGIQTEWTPSLRMNPSYFGTTQGEAAVDFQASGLLTNVMSVFAKSATEFSQLAIYNPSNGANASTDFISYTADGNNTDGWIDMGITSSDFSDLNFGITGPHDGYIFMSAPRGTTFDIVLKKVIGVTATITTGAAHGYLPGDQVRIVGISGMNGLQTIVSTPTTTQISFTTVLPPSSEVPVDPFGSVFKPKGDGSLVLATDLTGKKNNIIFAAGGYSVGTTQMEIFPDEKIVISIPTNSTSPSTGALVVAGGIGVTGEVFTLGGVHAEGVLYAGDANVEEWAVSAALTSPAAVFETASDPSSYGQLSMHNSTATSSSDIIAYASNGTDEAGYIDIGITGASFNDPDFPITGINDGYLFMSAPTGTLGKGNLIIATGLNGSENNIIFGAGGFADQNTQMTIFPNNKVEVSIGTPSTSATTGALVVLGGVGITGDVNIAGNISFGGEGTQISTANLAVVAPMIFTGDGSLSSTMDLGLVTEGKYTVTNLPGVLVVNKYLSSNVATLITKSIHNLAVGDSVTIALIDGTFDGVHTVTAIVNTKSFSFAKTAGNVASTRIGDETFSINQKTLASDIATLRTTLAHSFLVGDEVVVTGMGEIFDGSWIITAITLDTFSFARSALNVAVAAVSPVGTAVVNSTTATSTASSVTRTRWSSFTKNYVNGTWVLASNISTIPTTAINYSQNTYDVGGDSDVIYDTLMVGGLYVTGSEGRYGAPYGTVSLGGDISSPAWGTAGIGYTSLDRTLTDTSSIGVVTNTYTHKFGADEIKATNATTFTNYATAYFDSPFAGTNVAITNQYSLIAEGQTLVKGKATFTGGLVSTGTTEVSELREPTVDISLSGNVGTLDWTAGNIYHINKTASANFTLDVINLPTDASYMYTINVMMVQNGTGYYPSTFNIAGVGQTIRWPGGTAPTPTATNDKIDIFSFTMQRTSAGAWIVYGASALNF